jgi:hypothetical protein
MREVSRARGILEGKLEDVFSCSTYIDRRTEEISIWMMSVSWSIPQFFQLIKFIGIVQH